MIDYKQFEGYTPGRWEFSWQSGKLFIIAADGAIAEVFVPHLRDHIQARLIAAAPELLAENKATTEVLLTLANHGYCPNWGCDLWNTAGCSVCPVMRSAYDLLVARGLKPVREYAAYDAPTAVNIDNMNSSRLQAENKKLREALRPFAEQHVSDHGHCHAGLTTKEMCGRCSKILAARAALNTDAESTTG